VHRDAAAERYRIVSRSPALLEVVRAAERVAKVPRPVLVLGERGTGKELVAHVIHTASGARGPFIAVNCAAFAEPLLESELFGHERGAYTGADRRVPGKFELAADGTLFLDEIGNTTLGFQRKILRAVEYGAFVRVGGHVEVRSRARIVAATNTDLERAMRDGAFLPDLYDRLAFEVLRIPPLRERPEDVELPARHFLERFVAEVPAFGARRLSREALDALRAHPFPGNVRELKNVIERAVYRDGPEEIGAGDLGELAPPPASSASPGTFHEQLEQLERNLVADALHRAAGVQSEAARLLGLTYDQLRHYVRKHRR
jgi:DNA-binding NtrC family response regulator